MNQIRFAFFAALLTFMAVSSAAENSSPGVWVDYDSFSQLRLPPTVDAGFLLGFEYLENEIPKVLVIDVNNDGVEDFLVASADRLCGTGGCLYTLVDGKTKKRIGDFFGAPILIVDKKINEYPIITSYAHSSSESGVFATYVFDGEKYQVVSNVDIAGKSVEELFRKFDRFHKVKGSKNNE